MSTQNDTRLSVLDDKFWVWETIEEATRPHVSEMTDAQVNNMINVFAGNYKGSDLLWEYLEQRIYRAAQISWK